MSGWRDRTEKVIVLAVVAFVGALVLGAAAGVVALQVRAH